MDKEQLLADLDRIRAAIVECHVDGEHFASGSVSMLDRAGLLEPEFTRLREAIANMGDEIDANT